MIIRSAKDLHKVYGWYGKRGSRKKVVRELNGIQNGKCKMCGKNGNNKLELDHIKKLSDGGEHEFSNFQLLCTECHDKKDNIPSKRLNAGLK